MEESEINKRGDSFNKIKETLNFKPQYTLERGAKKVFDALKKGN